MNAIFTRRSVRQFDAKPVEREKIEKLLRAAMQAPSANNQQPWEFVVVKGKDNLEKLAQYNPYAGCLRGANLAIIVLGNANKMMLPEHWEQDLGGATQNIQLEAVELGLGSVWLGTAPNKAKMDFIRKLYGMEQNLLPYAVLAVGYPKDENANYFVDRYDESSVRYIE